MRKVEPALTARQSLGIYGEQCVVRNCSCPRCKRIGTLVRLPKNFKCADVICDFCGYLAQVKATVRASCDVPPRLVLGAAWRPQKERMDAGIYFPIFIVIVSKDQERHSIFYLSADLQRPEIFKPRKALSEKARRAGWQGFIYDLESVKDCLVRLR